MCMGWAYNQLIETGDNWEAKGCNSMTVRARRTQPLLTDDGHSNHPRTGKRHWHPQPARQPLMLVINQNIRSSWSGYGKDWTHKGSILHHKPKKQHFATTPLKFGLSKCSVTTRMQPSLGPEASCQAQQDKATETGKQQRPHEAHIWDQYLRAQLYIILRRSHGQVTKVPRQAPHITTEYSTDSRNRIS